MHLKRLEVFGFKSFAEKTTLEFGPGIAAIVGPNGCGKSNVFDAVRWVLGEQSAKDLRGSSMEDVIFNGTDKRTALGFAEVGLTFSNEDRVLPYDNDEVTVMRRLYRSGESEYIINKNNCRLKDIVEMFMGTGIGAEAYSLVAQGRVDMVVSAKPDDRRQIFDEAAGITKYKSKKKEALSKLKETEDNLLRINDIVVEVKRQIATIERQAKKAQKYKEDYEQLKNFEIIMARFTMDQFIVQTEAMRAQVSGFLAKEQEGLQQLEELNARINDEQELIAQLDEEINELRAQQIRLENEININEQQITFNTEKLETIKASLVRLSEEKAAALERCQINQVKIEEFQQALTQLNQSLETATQELNTTREQLAVLVHSVDAAQTSIKTIESEILALNSQEVRLKNQLTDNLKRMTENLARKTRLEQENSKIANEQQVVTTKFETINQAISSTQVGLDSLWMTLNNQRSGLEELKLRQTTQEQAIDNLEHTHVFLVSQKDFIEKMQVQYQDIPDPVVEGKFVSTVRPKENQTGIIGKIKSIQEIPATENSPQLFEIVYETKYIELDLAQMAERIVDLERQVAQAIDVHAAIERDMTVANGTIDGTLKQIQDQEKRLSVLEAQKNDIELETGKIAGELHMLVAESSQVEADLETLKTDEVTLSTQLNGIVDQIKLCQDEIKSKQLSIADRLQDKEDLQIRIAQSQSQVNSFADKQRGLNDNLSVYVQTLDRDLSDIARFDRELTENNEKTIIIDQENTQLNDVIEQTRGKQQDLLNRLEDKAAQKNEMVQRLTVLRNQTRGIEDEIIAAKNELHEIQMKEQEIQFQQRSLKERLLQSYKIEWDTLDQVIEAPSTAAETFSQVGEIIDGVEVTAAIVEEVVVEEPVEQPQVNYEELSVEIERLKKRCESYGAVNLVAIEEFDELKNRHEFLTKQQSDLLTAREQLLSTIQKINRTTRQMFTETFTKVNEEFQIYFRQLFGGGEAQLILLDPENALECGIDIVARPPGKKPQSISLLSGGEKTLTAIGLIFAVFKVNPSPFCVLDEIDAALDENNVGRFANMLKDFAKIAQFVVITHNKRTMQVADMMYGVTQQERGISRIVSVKFNEAMPQPVVAKAPAAQLATVEMI